MSLAFFMKQEKRLLIGADSGAGNEGSIEGLALKPGT